MQNMGEDTFNMGVKKGGGVGFGLLPKHKKAQEMSTTTIILIILGVIILVVLALGFKIGWGKVLPFLPSNNVQNVVTACGSACATESQYDFCTAPRTLKADDLKAKAGVDAKEATGTCSDFSKAPYTAYKIETCSTISC